MLRRMLGSLRSRQDRSTWSDERWYRYLLDHATTPHERLEIEEIFARAR